jgi:hypothetical protein
MGIGVAVTAIAAYLIKVRAERGYGQAMLANAFAIVLFCNLGLVLGAGHYGGSLTHGSDYLVTYMPNPMRQMAGLPPRRVVIDPLTPEQIQLIGWWIDKGAPLDKKVAELGLTPEAELALNRLTGKDKSPAEALIAKNVAPAKAEDIEKLRTEGAVVVPVAQESGFLHAQFRHTGGSSGDEQLKLLVPVKEQLTWLDLAGTGVSEAGLAQVAGLPNLTRLHLQKTQVTDAGLAHLKGLEHLSYLNLYGTQVTDAGLKQLEGLKNLRSLYLWQTKVTEAGVKALQEKNPGLKIDTGLSAQTSLAGGEKPADSVKVTSASLQN